MRKMDSRKRWSIIVLVGYGVLMTLFAHFGEEFYERIHPKVILSRVSAHFIDGAEYLCIPREAVIQGSVFLVEEEPGFYRTNAVCSLRKVDTIDAETHPDLLIVTSGLQKGERVVIYADRLLQDHHIVIEAKGLSEF